MISKKMVTRQKTLFDDENSDQEYLKLELKRLRKLELEQKKKDAELKYAEEYEKYFQVPIAPMEYYENGTINEYYAEFFKNAKQRRKEDRKLKNRLKREQIGDVKKLDNLKKEEDKMKENVKIKIENQEIVSGGTTLNKEQEILCNRMEESTDAMLIGGSAGVGKSYLIEKFMKNTTKTVALLAPTGIAALNIGAQTIHSFFQLPPTILDYDGKEYGDIHIPFKVLQKIRSLETIIIDEISMVNPDLIEGFNVVCQMARNNSLPFGGIQVICFGDLYQLPPVISNMTIRNYLNDKYGGIFFFNTPAFDDKLDVYELTHIYRQQDEKFKNLLNRVRIGDNSKEVIEELNKRVIVPQEENIITLATTNAIVDNINKSKLEEIENREYTYFGIKEGDIKESSFPADQELHLKVGAQVMLTANLDPEHGLVNGTLGTVTDLSDEIIIVKINDNEYKIDQYEWKAYSQEYNAVTQHLDQNVVGTYKQYPLKLAWAVTIHKSQGKTFQSVLIDLGDGAFDAGQLYVALSRCTTLEKLYLKRPIKPSDIKVNQEVVDFMKYAKIIDLSENEDTIE